MQQRRQHSPRPTAAALGVRGASGAGQERGGRTRSVGRAALARIRGLRSEYSRVGPDGRGARVPSRALRSGPGTGGPLSAGAAAAGKTCAGGHAPARSLVPSGVPADRPVSAVRPGPRSPRARSSPRAPDKMARPVRGAFGAPRRSPCPVLWLLLLLRLGPATAAADPRPPCAAACTCAGDSLDCGGRGLAALPGDLPAWTRSL